MKIFHILFSYMFLCAVVAQGQERRLVWEENFAGKSLNESSWNIRTGDGCPKLCGWGNNELQEYSAKNYRIHGGMLHIQASIENGEYSSARINTKGKREFQYGSMEARIQVPKAKGLWAAYWMLGSNIDQVGWPLCGEIDIMEYVGKEPNVLFTTLHTQDSHGASKNTRKDHVPGTDTGFHLYRVDWTTSKISFYIDDEHFYTFEKTEDTEEVWPFDQPFYFVLNLAVGGNFGGSEIDDEALPAEMIVDYIRVYQ